MSSENSSPTNRFARLGERLNEAGRLSIDRAKLDLSEKIYSAMQENQVTEAELSRRLGTSRAYVNKVLQGSTNFTIESLVRIGDALECELSLDFKKMTKRSVSTSHNEFILRDTQTVVPSKVVKPTRSNIRDFAEYKMGKSITVAGEDHNDVEVRDASGEIAA